MICQAIRYDTGVARFGDRAPHGFASRTEVQFERVPYGDSSRSETGRFQHCGLIGRAQLERDQLGWETEK